MSYVCPKCGSEHITTHKNIYEHGTADINLITNTVSIGENQSKAASKYAIPPKKSYFGPFTPSNIPAPLLLFTYAFYYLSCGFIVFMVNNLLGMKGGFNQLTWLIVALLIPLPWWMYCRKYNSTVWVDKVSEWLKWWHCNKCGNDFIL